ncbi:DEAD/DEAH box helicase [Agromyces seonyuensis]|uniref:DEAD/DEAH box helicase n=1 Tax=Agromyces seonyuensis TaxID=2662446 RepID=A0A6I4P534_9MICO|nr:DEAD/DEAH box helicase [Agromyces seonyuensis]MWB98607.1 DEAD/DEAH box helicase [Agromyces seonyuensis]
MPKNKKPAGGRPARNFDPNFAAAKKAAKKQAGSRSPGHRGYRAPEEAPAGKDRWSRDERVAAGRSTHRSTREGREERAPRDDRAPRQYREDRPQRRSDDDRPRRYDRDDRAPRRDDRGERPQRRFEDDRPRRYDRDDRAPRRDDRDDRGPRRDDRGDRGPRRDDRGERPQRRFEDDRPRRYDRDERAPRRDDRAPRRDDRDDRAPRRDDRGDRAPRRDDRGERPQRRFDDARPQRQFREDRPQRGADRGDRGPRRDDRREFDRPGFQASERRASSFYPSREDRAPRTDHDDVVLERLEAEAIQAETVEGVTFGDLGLGGNIVTALAGLGAEHPFPIQAATIPVVLEGRDVLGRGKTGSGKTIAFGAPTVERLANLWAASGKAGGKRQMGRAPRAIILAPTRELALQIDRTVQPIAQSIGLFTTQVYGGVPQARQVGALRRGVDIVIGTPGRIEDLHRQGHLDLSGIQITVLDEADHMCDLGFLEPVQRILRETPAGSQRLLFSATLDTGVAALVDEFLTDPAVHEVAGEEASSSTIEHRVLVIDNRDKRDFVARLADRNGKTLVFSRTRAFAEDLVQHLEDAGVYAVALHGDLNQAKRTRNLAQLTSGRVDVLVATDVAARGIHVDDIDLVIQADAPDEYKTYLHRAGRTGRAGKAGRVVTLIPRNRQRRMEDLLSRAEIAVDFEFAELGDDVVLEIANGEVELPSVAAGTHEGDQDDEGVEFLVIDDEFDDIEVEAAAK